MFLVFSSHIPKLKIFGCDKQGHSPPSFRGRRSLRSFDPYSLMREEEAHVRDEAAYEAKGGRDHMPLLPTLMLG
jgi:hypothetical protein